MGNFQPPNKGSINGYSFFAVKAELPSGKSVSKGYEKLIYVMPHLSGNNTFAQTERLNGFIHTCQKHNVSFAVTELPLAEREIDHSRKNAFICPTDLYAIQRLSTARRHKAGIIGFDNIRLIDDLHLTLDSVAYDIDQTARILSGYMIEHTEITSPVRHRIVKRGSI